MDPGVKLLVFIAVNVAALALPLLCKGILLILLVPLVRLSGASLLRIIKESRYIAALLGLVILSRIIYSPYPPDMGIAFLRISSRSIADAADYAAAVLSVFLLMHVFISTTSVLQIKRGVYECIRPLSVSAAYSVSLLVALSLGRFPLIIDQYREIREALLSRGLTPRRKPLRWIIATAKVLLERTIVQAAQTRESLLARGIEADK